QVPAGTWNWLVPDGLGNVRGVVNSTTTPIESQLYDPYGAPYGNTGGSQTSFGFTGEWTDGNGLVNLRARYYNPTIGQFFSLDPLETLNRYQYVGANPINAVDPSGLCPNLLLQPVCELHPEWTDQQDWQYVLNYMQEHDGELPQE